MGYYNNYNIDHNRIKNIRLYSLIQPKPVDNSNNSSSLFDPNNEVIVDNINDLDDLLLVDNIDDILFDDESMYIIIIKDIYFIILI